MLKNILICIIKCYQAYTNGGFWISRYEIGDKESTISNTVRKFYDGASHTPVSQKDQIPYNYLKTNECLTLARNMSTDENKISSLLFGIQWDLVCKYLEGKDGVTQDQMKKNCSGWGNYVNNELQITSENAKRIANVDVTSSPEWTPITGKKPSMQSDLLTTGASDFTKKMNIYDLAGNVSEITLEYSDYPANPTVERGEPCTSSVTNGMWRRNGGVKPSVSSKYDFDRGFRCTLF